MSKKYVLLLLISCIYSLSYAQDGVPVYADYFADNLYLLHPSMAGASHSDKLRITARKQWMDQEDAPNLQTLTGSLRLAERSGMGVIFFNDSNGFHSQQGGYLSYAHHILFSRSEIDINQLSLGLTAGIVKSTLDETHFDLNNFDPVIAGIIQSSTYYNVDAGMSYNFIDFSAHFTIKNIVFQNRRMYTDEYESSNQRRYLLSGAYSFSIRHNTDWYFEPSLLFQYYERTKGTSLDVNFKSFKKMDFGTLWGGLSYRKSFDGGSTSIQEVNYLSPVVGFNYKQFIFAYTYTYQTVQEKFNSGSFHQISLGYNFLKGSAPYACNCPAVN